jgi:hemerythrin-like metal-binding protein
MAFLEWSEKMSVGDARIDGQHRTLVDLVNKLYEAMSGGKGDDVIGPTMTSLITYTKNHFAHEERFMQQIGYPQLEAHRQLHQNLTVKVQDMQSRIADGQRFSPVALAGFLKDWLTSHILSEDKKYTAFMHQPVA